MRPLWPLQQRIDFYSLISQSRTVRSLLPEAILVESGENAKEQIIESWVFGKSV